MKVRDSLSQVQFVRTGLALEGESLLAINQAFRPITHGRIRRLMWFLSICTLPIVQVR